VLWGCDVGVDGVVDAVDAAADADVEAMMF
jgi:hypothetical protein